MLLFSVLSNNIDESVTLVIPRNILDTSVLTLLSQLFSYCWVKQLVKIELLYYLLCLMLVLYCCFLLKIDKTKYAFVRSSNVNCNQ